MKQQKLSQNDIKKIEKCLFEINKPCEVKMERGKPTVIIVTRNVMQSSEEQSKN